MIITAFFVSFLVKAQEIYPPDFDGLKYYDAAIKYGKCFEAIHHPTKDTKKNEVEKCRLYVGSYEAQLAHSYVEKFELAHGSTIKTMSGEEVIKKEKEIYKELKELYKRN